MCECRCALDSATSGRCGCNFIMLVATASVRCNSSAMCWPHTHPQARNRRPHRHARFSIRSDSPSGRLSLDIVPHAPAVAARIFGLLGVIEFFSHRPPGLTAANAGHASKPNPAAAEFPLWIDHRFGPEQTERLRQAARSEGVTLNDLLLASLFLATDDWFAVHRPAGSSSCG